MVALNKPPTKGAEPYLEKFELIDKGANPPWVYPLRKAGISRFAEAGFPTLNDEDWRFTNVSPITRLPFRPVVGAAAMAEPLCQSDIQALTFGRLPCTRLVFVNGRFMPQLSSPPLSADGLVVTNLAAGLSAHSAVMEKHLGKYAQDRCNSFADLNTAFFQDGAFILLPEGKVLDKPIHLLFVTTATEAGTSVQPRLLVIAGPRSQATLLESYASNVETSYFTNVVSEIVLENGAILEHCKFQDESPGAFHLAAIHARLGKASNFISHSIALGARLSRNNIRTSLAGDGVECVLNGLYITKADQLADHHMIVEHAQPHCNSHEYYNGILDGRSKGVFHGRILVRQIAQKTDAKQTNKNLLLSDEATVDTKPQLEIYADDVKCTHGATIGQLNEDAIFYLRARGIGEPTARQMLIHAFAGEIIERVRHTATREELDHIVWQRLESNPHVGGPHEPGSN
jgi:Fe-S cluster assembly protein SufD